MRRTDAGAFLGSAAAVALLAAVLPPPPGNAPEVGEMPLYDQAPAIRVLLERLAEGRTLRAGDARLRDAGGRTLTLTAPAELRLSGGRVHTGGARFDAPAALTPLAADGLALLGRRYPGTVHLYPRAGEWIVVNEVDLEVYLEGVVLSEMGAASPGEALKAQAVASRSYALQRLRARAGSTWHVRADQRSQVYRGIPERPERAARFVTATRGCVLVFEGRILPALFSSTCGGSTRPAVEAFGGRAPPPLDGVACGYCDDAPLATWSRRVPLEELARRLGRKRVPRAVRSVQRTASGRLARVRFDTGPPVGVTALRRALRAPSSWLTSLSVSGGRLEARGRGFGHAVGLCQHGAQTLARSGHDFAQIVAHYYPGASLRRVYPAPAP